MGLVLLAASVCGGQREPQAQAPAAVTPVASNRTVGPPTPPSCAHSGPGLSDCGANKESCCTSPLVTGVTYYRTYKNGGTGATGLAEPATVSTFRLDKYLVTVGRFRQFVKAWNGGAGYAPTAGSGKHTHLNVGQGLVNVGGDQAAYETGWVASDDSRVKPTNDHLKGDRLTWTPSVGGNENLPINGANWWESYAFCIWDGGFLPSEAEWESAAAGGNQQREYPWGSAAPGTANQYAICGAAKPIHDDHSGLFGDKVCYYPSTAACAGVLNIAPVGTATLGGGRWGQLDLAGEAFQWNLDSYAAYVDPCTDCVNLGSPHSPVYRGGSFDDDDSHLLPPDRSFDHAESRSYKIGLRCARAP
jgi:sulfatase modifying factor 1